MTAKAATQQQHQVLLWTIILLLLLLASLYQSSSIFVTSVHFQTQTICIITWLDWTP